MSLARNDQEREAAEQVIKALDAKQQLPERTPRRRVTTAVTSAVKVGDQRSARERVDQDDSELDTSEKHGADDDLFPIEKRIH